MRILWAFDITPAPGTEMPIDPNAYASEIPGNPGQNMPVRLSVRSKQKAQMIDSEFEEELSRRPKMVSIYLNSERCIYSDRDDRRVSCESEGAPDVT